MKGLCCVLLGLSLAGCSFTAIPDLRVDAWRKCERMKQTPEWSDCTTMLVVKEKVACEGSCRE